MKLFRIYLVVVVLFLLALAAVVALNRVADRAHERTARAAELWSAAGDRIGMIDEGAGALDRPANEVFETRNVPAARADLEKSVAMFRQQLAPLFLDLADVTSPAEQKELAAAKAGVAAAVRDVLVASEDEFKRLEAGDEEGATAAMVAVDFGDDEVRQRLSNAAHLARTIRLQGAARQTEAINAIHVIEHRAALLLLPLIFLLTFYGWRLVRAIDDHAERARLLRTVQESEERFQLVARATENVIWDLDLRTDMAWTNNAFRTRFGHACGTIPARFGRSLLHPEDRERALDTIMEALGNGASSWSQHYRVRRADGSYADVDEHGYVVRDGDGTAGRLVGTFFDVSERRAVERLKDEFISIVSHELRTPLTSIRGALGLLAGGRVGVLPEKAARMIDIAVSNSDRLIRLINDMLDIERMESGQVTLTRRIGSVEEIVDSAIEGLRPLAERSGIRLETKIAPANVWADSDRLVQTLTNLIGNAIRFAPPQTVVTVSASIDGDHVMFRVADQGRGIPADKLASIFDRFQQVDASDAREKGGSGLGLTISRSIVRQHGGDITVESEVGKGSTFSFAIARYDFDQRVISLPHNITREGAIASVA